MSALCIACSEDRVEVVRSMILAGAKVVLTAGDSRSEELVHPICCAANNGHADLIDPSGGGSRPQSGIQRLSSHVGLKKATDVIIALVDAGARLDEVTERIGLHSFSLPTSVM